MQRRQFAMWLAAHDPAYAKQMTPQRTSIARYLSAL
jgi:hypothetical protein